MAAAVGSSGSGHFIEVGNVDDAQYSHFAQRENLQTEIKDTVDRVKDWVTKNSLLFKGNSYTFAGSPDDNPYRESRLTIGKKMYSQCITNCGSQVGSGLFYTCTTNQDNLGSVSLTQVPVELLHYPPKEANSQEEAWCQAMVEKHLRDFSTEK